MRAYVCALLFFCMPLLWAKDVSLVAWWFHKRAAPLGCTYQNKSKGRQRERQTWKQTAISQTHHTLRFPLFTPCVVQTQQGSEDFLPMSSFLPDFLAWSYTEEHFSSPISVVKCCNLISLNHYAKDNKKHIQKKKNQTTLKTKQKQPRLWWLNLGLQMHDEAHCAESSRHKEESSS